MSNSLTLREHIALTEASDKYPDPDWKRRGDLTYEEQRKKKTNELEKLVVKLTGSESGQLTKLAKTYEKIQKALDLMAKKKDSLNTDMKNMVEPFWNAEDALVTRVIETAQLAVQLAKTTPPKEKREVSVNHEAVAKALAELVSEELKPKIDEIYKQFTTEIVTPAGIQKSPGLSVKPLEEGLKETASKIKAWIKGIGSWIVGFDKKFSKIKKLAAAV